MKNYHMYCPKCGEEVEIHADNVEDINEETGQPYNICDNCGLDLEDGWHGKGITY